MGHAKLIDEAEALAADVVEMTARERAALRAVQLSDCRDRPEFRKLHRRAVKALVAGRGRLAGLVHRLHRAGDGLAATVVWCAMVKRCEAATLAAACEPDAEGGGEVRSCR